MNTSSRVPTPNTRPVKFIVLTETNHILHIFLPLIFYILWLDLRMLLAIIQISGKYLNKKDI